MDKIIEWLEYQYKTTKEISTNGIELLIYLAIAMFVAFGMGLLYAGYTLALNIADFCQVAVDVMK